MVGSLEVVKIAFSNNWRALLKAVTKTINTFSVIQEMLFLKLPSISDISKWLLFSMLKILPLKAKSNFSVQFKKKNLLLPN